MPYLRDILSQYESALDALKDWKGVRRGLLRIGAGPSLANYLLPPILKDYHAQFPGVDLDLQTGNSLQLPSALQSGGLDLALVVAQETIEDPSLRIVFEGTTEIVLVSSFSIARRRIPLRSLRDLPLLLFRKGSRIENLIDHYLAGHGLIPNVIMRFDSA